MNNILTEKEYQHFIMDRLSQDNGYVVRKATSYDRLFAMDRELLFQFLNDTQPDEMAALRKIYKADLEDTLVSFINAETTKARGSLLDVLKHGIEISNMKLELMYTKPATTFNQELLAKYEKNIFSVMEEVWASNDERVDLVIFLNGIAIMSFELKCNAAGQSYQDAIYQYRVDRDPKTRLFWFKAGCLVNFAMDLEQVYMTTKLAGNSTFFLPFNMGNGEGVNAGAGNPTFKDKYSVSYMWEDILKKDTVLDLISKFIFIETKESKDELTGKTKKSENVIFPRYHQLDVIRKLLADVRENSSTQNYLIQHSAGSGKTNSIAWLAHRLTSLHDADNKIIFDNVVIVTDRVVVDRQLQKAIMGMEHKAGLIRVMDDKCNSADLAIALNGNTKIIATTIQKFPYIVDSVAGLKDKRFAVIIDEAHSSTAGKDMAAVTMSLGSGEQENGDVEDMITDEIRRNGKQANVSMFAFTATPKPTTIQLFGRLNTKGQREAFHIYSMKQAVEEGFILDVLQNYTTYDTFYQLNKEIEEDPRCKTADAKRQIARFVELHETNIAQRVEVIVEHFRTTVMPELGGMAKAMVITASRQGAVKYRQAFENYTQKKGYTDIKALVAFSGKVKLPDDDTEYSEVSMNGFPEDRLTKEFDGDDYQVLLVANKYQTGFDQPKLCAMYVLKKLKGVSAVQTLSRLNRICPPFEKKTFVLDFVNTYEDIKAAFAPYYTTTLLSTSVTPTAIYDLEAQIDAYTVLDPDDIEKANELLYKGNISSKDMLSYAFTTLNQGGYEDVATEEFENMHNLFAAILAKGISRQLKQGLYREYLNRKEDVAVVRGKIDMPGTIQNRLARKRVLTCEYDELSENNLLNQILKTTVMLLLRHTRVDQEYKSDLKKEMLFFSNVDTIDPTTIRWSAIRFQRNNNTYRMLISLCQLILEGMLLTTDSGEYKLASFVDEQRMNRLYEKFILEYYAKECPQVTATASQIPWALDDGIGTMLPVMQSDIMLTRGSEVLIIDAKYYTHTTQTQYDVHTLHSGNLYQIFTYVKNKDTEFGDQPHKVSGMLLYAATDEAIQPDNSYQMSGNKISVKTLDLNRDFSEIAAQLNAIVIEHFA